MPSRTWEQLSDKEQKKVLSWMHVCRQVLNPKDPLYELVMIGVDYLDGARNKFKGTNGT